MARRTPEAITTTEGGHEHRPWPSPAEFAHRVRELLFENALHLADRPQPLDPARDDSPEATAEARVTRVNQALREAGREYELRIPPDGSTFAVLVRDLSRGGAITEYGAFVPPHNGSRASADVDVDKVTTALGQLSFLESMFYKVRRLSVVSDLSLYPYWLVGRRRFRSLNGARPELGLHYRFLQDFDERREARLYRAITPRWEIRRDRATGRRRWSGRLPA